MGSAKNIISDVKYIHNQKESKGNEKKQKKSVELKNGSDTIQI